MEALRDMETKKDEALSEMAEVLEVVEASKAMRLVPSVCVHVKYI